MLAEDYQGKDKLKDVIETLRSFDLEQFTKRGLGDLNFKEARETFEKQIIPTLDAIEEIGVENLILDDPTKFYTALSPLGELYSRILNFKLDASDPRNEREIIISRFTKLAHDLHALSSSRISYYLMRENMFSSKRKESNEILTEIKSIKQNAESTLRGIEKAASKSGVVMYAKVFSDHAETLSSKSKTWLRSAAVFGAAAILISMSLFFGWFDTSTAENIFDLNDVHRIIGRITLLIIFVAAALWCGRHYSVLRHLVAVNEHRANALQTFETFIGSTSDESVRDKVLEITANSIFAPAETGFVGQTKASNGYPMAQIVEVMSSKGSG